MNEVSGAPPLVVLERLFFFLVLGESAAAVGIDDVDVPMDDSEANEVSDDSLFERFAADGVRLLEEEEDEVVVLEEEGGEALEETEGE